MKFDDTVNQILAEDWKSAAAGAMMGLGALAGPQAQAEEPAPVKPIEQPIKQTEDAKFSVINPKAPGIPANTKNWKGIVVHHTESHDVPAKEIDRWHREPDKGFNEIGYNYVIRKDGTVEKGRSLTKSGAHAKSGKPYSRNSSHIGIVLTKKEGEQPTSQQIKSLRELSVALAQTFNIQSVERHHPRCPGKEIPVETLNNIVKQSKK